MTFSDRTFMGTKTQDSGTTVCLARAISAELRRAHPHHTAKHVAQDLGCTPKAATNLLDGHLSAASVAKVIAAYGPGWVAERVLEAAGTTLENYIIESAEAARQERARATERWRQQARLVGELRGRNHLSAGVDRSAP
jgi:hypothetical protein